MKHTKLIAWTGTLLAVSLFATSCFSKGRTIPEKAEAVTPFDASRYLGTWYEVARFDFKFERGLSKTTANYTLNEDGSIKVINRGYNAEKGKWKEAEGKAVFIGDPNIAMLKVSFFGPFYTGYNVIAIDPEYKYALVAGKNLDYLWLLSREPTMPQEIIDQYLPLPRLSVTTPRACSGSSSNRSLRSALHHPPHPLRRMFFTPRTGQNPTNCTQNRNYC